MNPNEYGWRCLIKIKFTPLSPPPQGFRVYKGRMDIHSISCHTRKGKEWTKPIPVRLGMAGRVGNDFSTAYLGSACLYICLPLSSGM